tara:strand:+ start:71 stop:913 length:843 start_codon:yes stop_codon:yes gene_type:complete
MIIETEKRACDQRIGVAGCGSMGLPMLQTLLANNIKVKGYDIRHQDDFHSIKEHFMESKSEFIKQSEIIFSIVRDEGETLELCEGKNGLFSVRDKKIIVICSTLSPKFIENLKRKAPVNIELLDAPMSGASIAAKEARLTFMVGSTRKQFEYISPLLFFMGTNVFHLGEFGSGMAIKVLNNFVTASTVVSVRKVIYQARRMNIDVDNLLKTIDCSSGQNWFSSNRAMIEWFEEIYEKDNTIGILEKDVRAYVDAYENSSDDINGDRHFSDAVLAELNNLR